MQVRNLDLSLSKVQIGHLLLKEAKTDTLPYFHYN